MREVRILTIEEIAERRLAYINKLRAENAELKETIERIKKETIERVKKDKSSYWNQDSLLKAASGEEE